MKEFGSDFHFIDSFFSKRAHLTDVYRNAVLLADGRQCIVALIRQYGWRRLWMPEYFCYEVIETIKKQTGIEIFFYHDLPSTEKDQQAVEALPFREGDALLRMNFFGLRNHRSNRCIPVPVIEDHTHDLLGHWALYSDADWCIASLRKSLPLPEGGMMWSPKGHSLTCPVCATEENLHVADTRWEGMQMKTDYLQGKNIEKSEFRERLVGTEDWFDSVEPTMIDERSKAYIEQFDINAWLGAKRRNWQLLRSLVRAECLLPEDESCTPFSFVILLDDMDAREQLRHRLIERAVYPAVLWSVPDTASADVQDFSHRMLSIHCDGRYTEGDMRQLADIINESL